MTTTRNFKPGKVCEISSCLDNVVQPRFGGVGFHVFDHLHNPSQTILDEVIAKRWRELNPSFARITDNSDWDKSTMDKMGDYLYRMQQDAGTEFYVTTWGVLPTEKGEARAAYAKLTVDRLEYLVRQKGVDNIRFYCAMNELSLKKWGELIYDMETFKDYHKEIHQEMERRGLNIKLLATDASPAERWHSLEWATRNMDDITGIYGAHHYINDHTIDDLNFYPWFLKKIEWAAGLARSMNKDFIIGEFGCKQDSSMKDGVFQDRCVYFETADEPMIGIQLAEAVIAAMNGGAYALGYWTFADFPDNEPSKDRLNKWGTFRWSGNDFSTRAHYYSYGLLTRFFRGPATVAATTCSDESVRAAVVRNNANGTYSVAVVNRNQTEIPLKIFLAESTINSRPLNLSFRKYVYDIKNVPQNPFGDLQGPEGKINLESGYLNDTIGPDCLAVYTTAYSEDIPGKVTGLQVERTSGVRNVLKWDASGDPDLCYYRIFSSTVPDFVAGLETQIGSTVSNRFSDMVIKDDQINYYKVCSVNKSGNASEA